jgi:outer membrane lipoprotein-sorting protein
MTNIEEIVKHRLFEAIKAYKTLLEELNNEGNELADEFQDEKKSSAPDHKIGRLIITKDGYFYWNLIEPYKSSDGKTCTTHINKGPSDVYHRSAVEKFALDHEMVLFDKYEPVLAMIREKQKSVKKLLKDLEKEVKALPGTKEQYIPITETAEN